MKCNCLVEINSIQFKFNSICRAYIHDSDGSLSHSFKDKSHYVKNSRHFRKMASKMADTLA